MKISVDLGNAKYDERWLQLSKSGECLYPSKAMFVKFLEQYADINAEVSIHSVNDSIKGVGRISIELEYPIDPEGYMNYEGKLFHEEYPDGYNEFTVKAKSFGEAIKEMGEQLILGGEEIKIWHHGIWQPIIWYMEEVE